MARIVCLFLVLFVSLITSEDQLIHIQAIWRHGERNPGVPFPGGLNNASAFPTGFGQLTLNGEAQVFAVGQKYRKVYIEQYGLLSSAFVTEEVYARSTDVDRTLASAVAFFAGFYPLSTSAKMPSLVPIHSIPKADDPLSIISAKCPKRDTLWKLVDDSKTIKKLLNDSSALLAIVMNKTQTTTSFNSWAGVFDAAFVEGLLGLPIPSWITPLMHDFEKLYNDYLATLSGFYPFPQDQFPFDLQLALSKLTSGPLTAEMFDRLILKAQCDRNSTFSKDCSTVLKQKFYAYSAHDFTEISLFRGLGFTDFTFGTGSSPATASSVVLELWKSNSITSTSNSTLPENYYVKIWHYRNHTDSNPMNLVSMIPQCSKESCPLSFFSTRADLLRTRPDWKSYCQQCCEI